MLHTPCCMHIKFCTTSEQLKGVDNAITRKFQLLFTTSNLKSKYSYVQQVAIVYTWQTGMFAKWLNCYSCGLLLFQEPLLLGFCGGVSCIEVLEVVGLRFWDRRNKQLSYSSRDSSVVNTFRALQLLFCFFEKHCITLKQ